jgi:hypothetical protein
MTKNAQKLTGFERFLNTTFKKCTQKWAYYKRGRIGKINKILATEATEKTEKIYYL